MVCIKSTAAHETDVVVTVLAGTVEEKYVPLEFFSPIIISQGNKKLTRWQKKYDLCPELFTEDQRKFVTPTKEHFT